MVSMPPNLLEIQSRCLTRDVSVQEFSRQRRNEPYGWAVCFPPDGICRVRLVAQKNLSGYNASLVVDAHQKAKY
ncbi:hypothetical protein HYALB_00009485 [Hymenoscyphus albidus]|uniref:Uncharacterized protein n=1 Tax=Hymenoscyphus albidus TaxID=595503 RepID=A0A9N9M1Y9_9HELO|nr:hypothetical protein HYALB_00009485 [Hymenoscyphus albidus]